MVATLALSAAGGSVADTWRLTPSVSTSVTATSNSGYDESRDGKGDVVIDVAPRMKAFGQGAGFLLDADFGLDGLYYARGSKTNEVLPEGRALLKTTLVDRWVYFDANARVAQTAENPFLGRPDVATRANRLATVSYELAPSISHDFTPTLNATARTVWGWDRREALPDVDGQTQQVRVQQVTTPLGWVFDWSNQRTHFQGDDDPALATSAIRATGVYSPDTRWKFGLIAGRERNEFGGTADHDNIAGLLFEGAPTERTLGTVTIERRFFGAGWNASLQHRSPFMALTAQWYRRPTARANKDDVLNTTTTAQLLNAMLTTRVPDPNQRAMLVEDMLSRLSLPAQMGGALVINASVPQLEQGSKVSAAFQGRLTTLTFTAFLTQLTPLRRNDVAAVPTIPDSISTRQYGFAMDLNRRLDELTSADVHFESARLRRIDDGPSDSSRDRVLRLTLTRQLDAGTSASIAVRRRLRDVVLDGLAGSVGETALIVGLSHRF